MFKKVLITEDVDFMSSGIKVALKSLKVPVVESVQYCDEAFLKLQKSIKENEPFDLLVSDLSFIDNPYEYKLKTGEDLIKEAKKLQPLLKTIVFSVEDKAHRVKNLCNNLKVDAFVRKDINGQRELKQAVQSVFNNEFFISPKLHEILQAKKPLEITDFDVFLLHFLSKGIEQKEIPDKLKSEGVSPCSISSVEKRIKILKDNFNASNPTQLVAIAKDFGLI